MFSVFSEAVRSKTKVQKCSTHSSTWHQGLLFRQPLLGPTSKQKDNKKKWKSESKQKLNTSGTTHRLPRRRVSSCLDLQQGSLVLQGPAQAVLVALQQVPRPSAEAKHLNLTNQREPSAAPGGQKRTEHEPTPPPKVRKD